MIVGLDHVQLAMPAGKEQEARAFYGEALGIAERAKPGHLAVRGGVWFENAHVKIHLGVDREFRPARKAHPGLLVQGLPDLVARLRGSGHEVVEDDEASIPYHVYVFDPFGNRLELIEASGAATERPGPTRA
jgi:catechol 2,3-dioxygenase-like lactoylglutathione lyase family enzyme